MQPVLSMASVFLIASTDLALPLAAEKAFHMLVNQAVAEF